MKAAFLDDIETIHVRETDTPTVNAGQALLKVWACSVCGSDLKIFHHGNARLTLPRIVGHEIAGEIVDRVLGAPGRAVRVRSPAHNDEVGGVSPGSIEDGLVGFVRQDGVGLDVDAERFGVLASVVEEVL